MGVIQRMKKPTTRRGKLMLARKEPKVIEGCKQVLFMHGRKTSDSLRSCVKDLYSLKKPDAHLFGKKNDILPFDNVAPIETFCRNFTSPLFVFASSNKKRPNNVIIGRTFDYQLLDMMELGVQKYRAMKDFKTDKVTVGLKPCLLFAGEEFETNSDLSRLKNLFIDFFQREPVKSIRLQGLEHVLMFTAANNSIYLRSYKILLKKTGHDLPRVELEEIGPSIDFVLRRTKLSSDNLLKTANKKPKELKIKKTKNVSTNVFGTKEAKIHVSKQSLKKIPTNKMKALRRGATAGKKNRATDKNSKKN